MCRAQRAATRPSHTNKVLCWLMEEASECLEDRQKCCRSFGCQPVEMWCHKLNRFTAAVKRSRRPLSSLVGLLRAAPVAVAFCFNESDSCHDLDQTRRQPGFTVKSTRVRRIIKLLEIGANPYFADELLMVITTCATVT